MHPGSQFYLASYGITGEMLSATMQTISTTARQIIERIEGESAKDEEQAGNAGLQTVLRSQPAARKALAA